MYFDIEVVIEVETGRYRRDVSLGLQRNFGNPRGRRRGSSGSFGEHRGFSGTRAQVALCLSVRPALGPCVREGSELANGLKAGVAASARRARRSRIFLITTGSSMLAYTLSAPPQCSQVKMSIDHIAWSDLEQPQADSQGAGRRAQGAGRRAGCPE